MINFFNLFGALISAGFLVTNSISVSEDTINDTRSTTIEFTESVNDNLGSYYFKQPSNVDFTLTSKQVVYSYSYIKSDYTSAVITGSYTSDCSITKIASDCHNSIDTDYYMAVLDIGIFNNGFHSVSLRTYVFNTTGLLGNRKVTIQDHLFENINYSESFNLSTYGSWIPLGVLNNFYGFNTYVAPISQDNYALSMGGTTYVKVYQKGNSKFYSNTYPLYDNTFGGNLLDSASYLDTTSYKLSDYGHITYFNVQYVNNTFLNGFQSINNRATFTFSYLDTYDSGYTAGYQQGLIDQENVDNPKITQAYQDGYADGVNEMGSQDTTAFVIFTGILNVALVPVNVFLKILNFEVFGINIGGLVSAFLTIAIVIILWRIISGNKND